MVFSNEDWELAFNTRNMISLSENEYIKNINSLLDEKLGSKMWPLVSDWRWIHRRVESVRLESNGDTRRHISFDFTIPQNSVAGWYSEDPSTGERTYTDMVIAPLSFLKKGTIVNLNLQDSSGNSLPSLSFSQNGTLTYNALLYRLKELKIDYSVHDILRENMSLDEIRCFLSLGIYDLIHSAVMGSPYWGEGKINNDFRQKFMDTLLLHIFDSIDAIDDNNSTPNGRSIENVFFSRVSPGELIEAKPGEIEKTIGKFFPQEKDEIFENDFPFSVRFLYFSIWYSIYLLSREERDSSSLKEKLLDYSRFVSLLGTVCTSYLFTTLISHERKEGSSEGEMGIFKPFNRTIVKFSCDTEMSDLLEDDSEKNDYVSNGRKISSYFRSIKDGITKLWMGTLGQKEILVRFSGWSARSTHLEIRYPETTALYEVERLIPKDKDDWVKKINFRTSSNRIHLTEHRDFRQPVISLWLTLGPERTWNTVLASLWSLLIALVCMLTVSPLWMQKVEITLDNILGLASLTFAVMFASYFTTSKHSVAKECWAPAEVIISLNFLASLLSPMGLWIISSDFSSLITSLSFIFFLLIPSLLSLVLTAVSIRQYIYLKDKLRFISSKDENPISTSPAPVIKDSVMAVTETGAYDTELLVHKADRKPSLEKANMVSKNVN